MNITTHEPDIVNEDILADMVSDFDGFLKERRWADCDAIIDNLRDLKEYDMGIKLAKRLAARKMTVPADYGEKFAWEDNPLKDVRVEGFEEEIY